MPSEEGLILDGVALVTWAMDVAGIPATRIVLLGQSLGTAVTAGVAEHFASQGAEFAGIVLVAGFSDLPTMLSGYRIAGFVPVLAPLRVWPWLLRKTQGFIVDKWPSAKRLVNIVRQTKKRLRLEIIHAKDDWDIPCKESNKLFQSATNATVPHGLDQHAFDAWKDARTIKKDGKGSFVTIWKADPNIIIRQEMFPYGGESAYPRDEGLTDSCRSQRHYDLCPTFPGSYEVFRF